MRIQSLKLTAFGPFTGSVLDLSDGEEGLHIIYGPNEAGKSSALRAIEDFLFGIPSRTADNFIHPYQRLRIGAELRHSAGSVLDGVRRKGNQNTLRQADDSTPLDESGLQIFLGEVDRDLFHVMFGLNHQRLRHGGAEIAKGGGRIGRLLFVAGAGLSDLQSVQERFQDESDKLFKSTGRSGQILDDIKKYQDARQAIKDAQVSVETWRRHDDALHDAEKEKEKLDDALRMKRSEQNRLIRIRDSLPTIVQWRRNVQELDPIREAPLLTEDFAESSNGILIELRKAEQKKSDAAKALERINDQLDAVSIPEAILGEADAIESLRDRLGGHRKAMSDRPKVETSQTIADGDAREILRKLGRAPDLEGIEELRLPTDKTVRIQDLGNQKEGIVERLQSARRDCDRLRRDISTAEGKLENYQIPAGATALRNKVRQIQQEGNLESQLANLQDEVQRLQQEADTQLSRLPLWSGTLEDSELLAVPSLATIERFENDLREAKTHLDSLSARRDRDVHAKSALTDQLEQLELQQSVPTQDELEEARRVRETGWQLLLEKWQEGSESEEIDRFVQRFPSSQTLPDAYRRSVDDADNVADQLRLDADRVATKAQLQSDSEKYDQTIEGINGDIEKAETTMSDLQAEWTALWDPLGISPLPPLEMRDWQRQQKALAELAGDIRNKEHERVQLSKRIETLHGELVLALQDVDVECDASKMNLSDLLAFAVSTSDKFQDTKNLAGQVEDSLQSDREDLDEAETRLDAAESALREWQTDWATEMTRLGLEENAIPSQANSVLSDINNLFQTFQEADQYRKRIEGIDRESREFQSDVRDLTERIASDLVTRSVDEAINLLSTRLQDARSKKVEYETLLNERTNEEDKLHQAEEAISEHSVELDEMCRQAECEEYEQLSHAATSSQRRKELEQLVRDLEDQLVQQSGGAGLEEFVTTAETEAENADALQPKIDLLEDDIKRISETRDEVLRQIEREEGELRKIDGSAVAAEKAAESGSLAARLEEQIHELAVLRAASAILSAGIEQHREKNQGPVLGRASDLFSAMTQGSFRGLRADYDERGEPILMGVRSDGVETVHVEGMSDGTCDQLYLSLRLASLETWFEQHEPLPFIVDDVLLNFDDDRAVAAMRVLAQLSSRTQIIFFTHHKHLVEMAEENLSKEHVFVHHLEA